jgi:hypothetical protein
MGLGEELSTLTAVWMLEPILYTCLIIRNINRLPAAMIRNPEFLRAISDPQLIARYVTLAPPV